MPVPFFNVLNGGAHSGNEMAFQETMIAPVGASSITEAIQMGSEVYQELKKVIVKQFGLSGEFTMLRQTKKRKEKALLILQSKLSVLETKEVSPHRFHGLTKHWTS